MIKRFLTLIIGAIVTVLTVSSTALAAEFHETVNASSFHNKVTASDPGGSIVQLTISGPSPSWSAFLLSEIDYLNESEPVITPKVTPSPAPLPSPETKLLPKVSVPSPTPAPVNVSSRSGGVNWDKLAQCESSGNWSANTGNGYGGGLQFSLQTWHAYGGTGSPSNASKGSQIAIALRVLHSQGKHAWPSSASRGSSCGLSA